MPIILQLKSTQRQADLDDIEGIIHTIKKDHDFKIKGHEIQQLASVIKNTTIQKRAEMVSNFCSKSEIEHLSYHTTIFENGENIYDKSGKEIKDSILQCIEEADLVRKRSGITNDVVIVFHMTYYVNRDLLPITKDQKLALYSKAKDSFIEFFEKEGIAKRKGIIMAVENSYPKYYPKDAIAGPFHPSDIVGLTDLGVKTVFDLSHYHLYSSYIKYGKGNMLGDLERGIHGNPPSWPECIKILSGSLVQLHLSDAKGFDHTGEGLPFGHGEITIAQVLGHVDSMIKRTIRGTIELDNGHLDHGRPQLVGARWLLENLPSGLLQE